MFILFLLSWNKSSPCCTLITCLLPSWFLWQLLWCIHCLCCLSLLLLPYEVGILDLCSLQDWDWILKRQLPNLKWNAELSRVTVFNRWLCSPALFSGVLLCCGLLWHCSLPFPFLSPSPRPRDCGLFSSYVLLLSFPAAILCSSCVHFSSRLFSPCFADEMLVVAGFLSAGLHEQSNCCLYW